LQSNQPGRVSCRVDIRYQEQTIMAGSVPETVARVEEKVDAVAKQLGQLCVLIEGDGSEDRHGLKVTVDRLVQSEKRRSWADRAVVTAFIGLIAERLWGLLR
jgi:hypothetical protein